MIAKSTKVARICARAVGVICLAFFRAVTGSEGELTGAPLIQRYTTEDYPVAPRHLGVLTDRQGRVFVGTYEGVLVFSHGRFNVITLPSDSSARKLVEGADGRIHLAAYDHFGYLEQDAYGDFTFVDLDARFDEAPGPHALGDVWDVALIGDVQYYLTAERLYEIGPDGPRSWATPGSSNTLFVDGTTLYLRIQDQGLMRFDAGSFVLVPGGELLATSRAALALVDEDSVIIGSRRDGFYRLKAGRLARFETPLDDWFRKAEPYSGTRLADGSFAIGALNGEVVHVDGSFKLLDRFTASSYPIVGVATDPEGGLWAATDGDLIRAAWPSPWTELTDADGLLGSIDDSVFFAGRRWVATSMGLFASVVDGEQRMRFARIDALDSDEVWDLAVRGDSLLVAHRLGVYQSDGKAFRKISSTSFPYEFIPSRFHKDRVYVLGDDGLVVFTEGTGGLVERAVLPIPGVDPSSLVEQGPGLVFVGNYRGHPVQLTLDPDGTRILALVPLDSRFGAIVEPGQMSSLSVLGETIVLGTRAGTSVWRDGRFVTDPLDGLSALLTRPDELAVRTGADGRQFAFTSRELFRRAGNEAWQRVQISAPRARGVVDVSIDPGGLVSVITWGALLTMDSRKGADIGTTPVVAMHRIDVLPRRDAATRLPLHPTTPPWVAPHRVIRFGFGVNSAERGIQYRSRLEGFEPGFSGWSESQVREFSGLAPRHYELRVEARAPSGRTFDRLVYAFDVAPRWYQTRWAAWAASALVLFVGWLLAWVWNRWRSRQLRAHNVALEKSIEEHTRELEVANQRLARLAVQDGLTGVTNRRGFEQAYSRLWNRLAESRQSLAVLMVDVDFFKQFNDAHGHLAGDEVLRQIARALESEIRDANEVLARFGGEEFAVLLPDVTIDDAMARAQQVRARCEDAGRAHDVTVSIGVAACVPRGGLKPSQLIDEADAALYRAKKAGRNRIDRGRTL